MHQTQSGDLVMPAMADMDEGDIEAFWILHVDTSTGKVLAASPSS